MTSPGFFTVVDGPSGVGKTTTARHLAERLTRIGHRAVLTCEPSSGPLGTLARTSTKDLRGLALACLVAADRYHHLETVIRPALAAGYVVVCDRYVPTSLVLQRLDGVPSTFLRNLNAHADRPDLTILLTGDPNRCRTRAIQRGTYSRFHGSIAGEADRYRSLVGELTAAGYPTLTHDVAEQTPEEVAEALQQLLQQHLPSR
jgi:dTMP kinase